jgi:hypothetical protein
MKRMARRLAFDGAVKWYRSGEHITHQLMVGFSYLAVPPPLTAAPGYCEKAPLGHPRRSGT